MKRRDVVLERPYLHWIRTLMRLPWPASSLDPAQLFMQRLDDDTAAGP
jgi:hypothetical protein